MTVTSGHDRSERQNLNELARLHEQLDNLGLWQLDSRINEVIEQLGLLMPMPNWPPVRRLAA